ncbi:Electrogenic sodium bicarbonate cotransporter 1 [Varanus komodoensis]|nr:Electrogenic sodium bicarbonate cotransporter 1 [Varanus komodoensis]
MSDGAGNQEKQPNGCGEKGKARSRTSLVALQSVNRSIFTSAVSPAAERIRFILGEDDDSPAPPQLFTELDELLAVDGQEMEWKETARWIKFEEKVEQGGERWSKPHVATLSLHSLFELRTCIEKGSIMLDMEASSLPQVVEMVVDNQIETGLLKQDMKDKVTYTLLRKHRHQTKKSNLRSLADIGKTVSTASRMFTNPDNGNAEASGLWRSLRDPQENPLTPRHFMATHLTHD